MSTLVSIDPGIRHCGVAVFEDKRLVRAALAVNPKTTGDPLERAFHMADAVRVFCPERIDVLVLERPQLGTYGPARQKDLVMLCEVGACIVGLLRPAVPISISPHDWKGSIDADVMIERVIARLVSEEYKKAELPKAKSLRHNLWDAVGIGLHHFGRLERWRVIAR